MTNKLYVYVIKNFINPMLLLQHRETNKKFLKFNRISLAK